MKINASITDFPLLSSLDTFFREFKAAGVDGIELVCGFKSRWNAHNIQTLSHKYSLPIVSFHQPPWSFGRAFFDEEFMQTAKKVGAHTVVFHPLFFTSLFSNASERYLEKVAKAQDKYKMQVVFENMKNEFGCRKFYPKKDSTVEQHLFDVYAICKRYGFKINFDTSHAGMDAPQKNIAFQRIFPLIGNIHLSSFSPEQDHLPLTMGKFDAKGFLTYLHHNNYQGHMTFEVFYPKLFSVKDYDFLAIVDSVKIVRKINGKW